MTKAERASKPEAPKLVALKRRIASDSLTVKDIPVRDRALRCWRAREKGLAIMKVAEEVGENFLTIRGFMGGPVYAAYVEAFKALEIGVLEFDADAAKKQHRLRIAAMIPDALARLRASLTSGVAANGAVVGSKSADRAMELVLEASGLLEQEGAGRPAVVIGQLVINQQVQTSADDDKALEALYRNVTTTTALSPPSEEIRP